MLDFCVFCWNDLILISNSKTWNETILFLYLNVGLKKILLIDKYCCWNSGATWRDLISHTASWHIRTCMACQHKQITILQVYLWHISLCMSVRAEIVSPEDLQLTGQEGSWLWKNSRRRTQKTGQDSVKSQCTQALCRLCRNSQRHCTVVIKRWEE